MSRLTIYLSRLLGLFFLIFAAALYVQRPAAIEIVGQLMHDRLLMLLMGMIALACGLAIVLAHNVWSGGVLPVVVTIIGWLFVIRGVLLLALPPEVSAIFDMLHYTRYFDLYELVTLVIGALLTYGGFSAAWPPSGTPQDKVSTG
jgi:vacuolar-type H+-ATPase subunit I/STV1